MLQGKMALITGASSGIGRACAEKLAKEGIHLILVARRRQMLDDLKDSLSTHDIQILTLALDITDYPLVQSTLNDLPQPIDILINNAGLALGTDSIEMGDFEDWQQMFNTNVLGLLNVTKTLLPTHLSKYAHIINISSIAGREVYPGGTVYCATKHAVSAISDGLRKDLLGQNIRVSDIQPGLVETEFSMVRFSGDKHKAKEVYTGLRPLSAEDVAESVLFSLKQPPHINISQILLMPTSQASTSHIHRKEGKANG